MINKYISEYCPHKNGKDDDAESFNKAIREISEAGGGELIVEAGDYMCGTIRFLDNVTINILKGAKIILNSNLDAFYDIKIDRDTDIHVPTSENCEYNGRPSKYFIYAHSCRNIGIKGDGIIDGNEEIFYGEQSKYHIEGAFYPRIPLVYFENCTGITIENITFQRSGFWTTHLVGCVNVLIDGLKVYNNLRMMNCDGIDPDHCKNVEIKNCYIEAADDGIVLKTTEGAAEYGACENIHVSDCTIISTSAAIKVGTESVSDFNNLLFENIKIERTNRGISFMLRDEGSVRNAVFKNIDISTRRFSPKHYWGKSEPIAITAVKRHNDTQIGRIENIVFENITADSENGILLYGEDSENISGIRLKDISLSIKNKTNWEKRGVDLRPSESYGLMDGESFVLLQKNVKGLEIENFNYEISEDMKKYTRT